MNTKIRINGNKNITHEKIKARLGLTDKKNQSVFYLEGGMFLTPKTDAEDFPAIMEDVETTCKRLIKSKLLKNEVLSTDFLMNFEVCSDRMKKDKRTYLSFQYHFKQKNGNNTSIVTLKDKNEGFFTDLLNDIEKELTSWNIDISKKR